MNRTWGDGYEAMNRTAFAHALGTIDRRLRSKDALHLSRVVAHICGSEDYISLSTLSPRLFDKNSGVLDGKKYAQRNTNVVDRVRSRIFSQIANTQSNIDCDIESDAFPMQNVGLNGLQRSLKILDTNGDNRLTKDQLKSGLYKFGVDVNYHEIDYLFTYFEADRSGCISANDFFCWDARRDEHLAHGICAQSIRYFGS